MPYVVVTSEPPHGEHELCERVASSDFEAGHFRRCLAERLAWAVDDAERRPAHEPAVAPELSEERLRFEREPAGVA